MKYIQVEEERLRDLLDARAWFEGNPEGALDEIEHRVRQMLDEPKPDAIAKG